MTQTEQKKQSWVPWFAVGVVAFVVMIVVIALLAPPTEEAVAQRNRKATEVEAPTATAEPCRSRADKAYLAMFKRHSRSLEASLVEMSSLADSPKLFDAGWRSDLEDALDEVDSAITDILELDAPPTMTSVSVPLNVGLELMRAGIKSFRSGLNNLSAPQIQAGEVNLLASMPHIERGIAALQTLCN